MVNATTNRRTTAAVLLAGAAVAVVLGVMSSTYWPGSQPLPTWGFSGPEAFKAWLSSAVLVLVAFQLVTALWIFGRLPGVNCEAPKAIHTVHRLSGAAAFVASLPVAYYCMYTYGFAQYTTNTRTVVHAVAGVTFYGAFAAKMLSLRIKNLPSWSVPVLGGLVLSAFVLAWATASLWWFQNVGFGR